MLSRWARSWWIRLGLGLGLSLMALVLAVRGVDFGQLWNSVLSAEPFFVLLALLSVTINILSKALRWWVLLGEARKQVRFSRVLAVLLSGQFLNWVAPFRAGDIQRVMVMGEIGRSFVFGTLVLEKWVDTLSYVAVILVTALLFPIPSWVEETTTEMIGLVITASLFLVVAVYYWETLRAWLTKVVRWFPVRLRTWAQPRIVSGVSSLGILRDRTNLAWILFWSILAWGTATLNNILVLRALRIELPLAASLVVLIALQAGISVVKVPATIGVFEYICVVALALFGVEQTAALGFGVLLHGIILAPVLAGGPVALIAVTNKNEQLQME